MNFLPSDACVWPKKRLKIPSDIAVIGFTDGILSRYGHPTLTTVDQPGDRMGAVAARLLFHRIENDRADEPENFHTEIIEATLIERKSTVND